jgi:hypothetical protein
MKGGDFTRSTFDEGMHFTKVNKQQGKVEVDADSNEQNDIHLHHERTFIRDIVGTSGTLKQDDGFKILGNFSFKWDSNYPDPDEAKALRIFLRGSFGLLWITEEKPARVKKSADGNTLIISAPDGSHTATITRAAAGSRNPVLAIDSKPVYEFLQSAGDDVWSHDYIIGKGDYYVDGILCENESDVEASRQPDILAERQVRFLIFEWTSAGTKPVQAAIAGFVSGMFPAMTGGPLKVTKTSETLITVTNDSTEATAKFELMTNEGKALLKFDTFEPVVLAAEKKTDEDKTLIYYQIENPSLASPHSPDIAASYIAYLDTWDQHVTHLEAPHIREKALGGVDTATRTRTAWQVRILPFSSEVTNKCRIWDEVNSKLGMFDLGRMQARAKPTGDPTDMCKKLYETAGYQGLENHLYRIEVHKGGSFAESTFKWSRDNGVVVSAITKIHDLENKIEIQSRGRDDNLDFKQDTWIEINDRLHEQLGLPGTMVKVKEVKENAIIYDPDTVIGLPITEGNFAHNPKARRWDSNGVLKLANTTDYIELEEGLEIRLGEGNYRTGDYWWVAARANSEESIEWPRIGDKLTETPQPLLPAGVAHHYAPLAVLEHKGDGKYSVKFDARSFFSSLADLIHIHYAGGDGQEAMPGNNTLAEPLRVAVTIGGKSVGSLGAKVRFTITKPSTPSPLSGLFSGFLSTVDHTTTDSSLEIATNEEGIAECLWTLDNRVVEQEVMAELVECGDAKLPPLYFGATVSGRGTSESANTGELNLIIPKTQSSRFPLVYGPFEHHVNHFPPPALLLGLVTLEGNGKIKYTEDYDTNTSVQANGQSIPDIALHFKPVEINEKEFKVHLWVCLGGRCEPPAADVPTTIELRSDWLKREMKDGFDFENPIRPKFYRLDTDIRVMLRWWAIPSEEHPTVPDTFPNEPPKVIVPNVLGADSIVAGQAVQAAGLRARFNGSQVNTVVKSQSPQPGSIVERDSIVELTMIVPATVPEVHGLDGRMAKREIQAAGLRAKVVEGSVGLNMEVKRQSPQGGSIVERDSTVDLWMGRREVEP